MSTQKQIIQARSRKFRNFTSRCGGITMRPYQLEAARAVLRSIKNHLGLSFVILFSRQSGKDELCANLKAYLLARYAFRDASIVEVNPTYKPQTERAVDRLDDRLAHNHVTRIHWTKGPAFTRRFCRSRVSFLSGDSQANVVGAVASLLLIVNEAQDISPAIYDKNLAPMAASTNATRLFMGTAWTGHTLLAREKRLALHAQKKDGLQRLFIYDADDVRKYVPAYGQYVDGEIARLGRQHPLIKTQYFNEELDAQAGMFTPAHRALMASDRPPLPAEGQPPIGDSRPLNAFLLDVAGQEEYNTSATLLSLYERGAGADGSEIANRKSEIENRDAVTLRIVEIDLSTLEILQAPTYRVVHTQQWTGLNHLAVFGRLKALGESWSPQHIVIDATGVGEGLWAMLDKAFPTRVIPVKFTRAKKSELGYGFLAVINTGRFRDCDPSPETDRQYAACVSEILPGPGKIMRWGVPEGTRDENGLLIHDDLPITDSLVAVLDRLKWHIPIKAEISHFPDPLIELSKIDPRPYRRRKNPNYHDPLDDLSRIR